MIRSNDKVTYNGLCRTLQGETAAESEIIMPDYCPGILKLVKTNAVALVRSRSVRGDRAYMEGAVEFTVIYLSDSAEGLQCVTHQVPFSQTAQLPGEADTADISVSARVSYANARALSPQKLYVKATIETAVNVFADESLALLADADEAFEKKIETAYVSDVLSVSQKTLKMEDEIEITDAPVAKILRYETCFVPSDKKIINNKMIVKAELSLKVVYICPEGRIHTQTAKFPVSQVLEVGEADENAECITTFSVSDCRFNIKDNQGKTVLDCDMEIDTGVVCFQNEQLDIISDAFSTTQDTECTYKPVCVRKLEAVEKSCDFREAISMENCAEIVDVCIVPAVQGVSYSPENGITCSGDFRCSVIYIDAENEMACSEKNVPFSVFLDADFVPTHVQGNLEMEIQNAACSFDGKDLSLRIDGMLKGFVMLEKEYSAVAEVTCSERKTDPAPVVLCYANSGEEIWDIAKRYGASPAKIMDRNGLSSSQLTQDRMLFIAK